ncbi:MAG: glycerol-3-phosphate dehydrogenase/oxidase [Mesorhizobium sp.]
MRTREEALSALENGGGGEVLIVGGGINGVGVLRDLAAQGIPATLVEMGDFCSGTSSAPSRLIHGGLRYLEQGEFKLVKESVEERDRLLMNAPHQVRPIRVWVPALSWFGGTFQAALRFFKLMKDPGPKGALILKLGLTFFDGFSWRFRSMPRHRLIGRGAAHDKISGLADNVKLVAEYYDARIDSPERLTMEIVGDAEEACPGALGLPYVSLAGVDGNTAILTDQVSGRTIRKDFRLIINCAGAWVDRVNAQLGISEQLVGGTRGSHLILDRPDIAKMIEDVMLYFETEDHRACLIYRMNDGQVLLGTTDLRTDNPDERETTEPEIDYLFSVMKSVLPRSNPRKDEISYAYSGVRPLPRQTGGAAGSISRDHTFRMFQPAAGRTVPVLALIGGKWTTYRACAEQLVDLALPTLDQTRSAENDRFANWWRQGFSQDSVALAELEKKVAAAGRVPPARAKTLVRRYGTTALRMAPELGQDKPLDGASSYSMQEMAWIAGHERVTHLGDLILRRTLMGFEGVANENSIRSVCKAVAPVLGWSDADCRKEIDQTLTILHGRHRVRAGLRSAA